MSTYDQLIEKGRAEGQRSALENAILTTHGKKCTAEFIANALDLPLDTVKLVLKYAA